MKNSAIRLIAALGTFTFGVALVTLWLAYTDAGHTRRAKAPCHRRAQAQTPPAAPPRAESPAGEGLSTVLSFCELVGNPERYDGKVVRVRAALRMSIHGLFLSDATCDRYENMMAVELPPQRSESLLMHPIYEATGSKYVGAAPVELVAIGRFERVTPSGESDSLLDTAKLRFHLMLIEKAVGTRWETMPGPRRRLN